MQVEKCSNKNAREKKQQDAEAFSKRGVRKYASLHAKKIQFPDL